MGDHHFREKMVKAIVLFMIIPSPGQSDKERIHGDRASISLALSRVPQVLSYIHITHTAWIEIRFYLLMTQ